MAFPAIPLSSIFPEMKVIKKKISVLGVKYNSKRKWIDINFGSVVFRLLQGQIMIDETPYSDEHLVPIKNIAINEKCFSFDSFYKNQDTHFEVYYSSFDIAMLIANYIKYINEYGVVFNNEYDSFDFLAERNELHLSLENELTGKRIVVSYNKYRNYFSLVYLEKAREFDPFGHAGLTPSGIIRLTPSGKIKMTPVDDTAGEFFCSFENPCPGTAGFNVKYYKI